MPEGLKTAASMIARVAAYKMPKGDKDSLLAVITGGRADPLYAPRAGHRRAVMMLHIAIVAHAVERKGTRQLSQKLRMMISSTFPKALCSEYVELYISAFDTDLMWSKDGPTVTIKVPKSVAADNEVIAWARLKWGAS
jgi:hypothetical protein